MVWIKKGCNLHCTVETDGKVKVYATLLVGLFDLVASLVLILHTSKRKTNLSSYILENMKKGIASNKGEEGNNK